MRLRSILTMCALLLPAGMAIAAEDPPAYMSLTIATAVEVSGEWNGKDSVFVADEVELLPKPRRPKLRGQIQAADSTTQQIMMFGRWIAVTDETQFLNVDDVTLDFSILKPGARAEASCKADSSGRWLMRHIRMRDVKDSDKIKGTITSVDFDGTAPDGFHIEGLRIRVTDETVIFKTLGTMSDDDDDDE